MKLAPIPFNENERLQRLYRYDILDSEAESDFDDLVELVSIICNCPISGITFIDKDRQWFKAEKNMISQEGAREDSFCAHTILQDDILVVEDAAKDERFFDNPHVTGGLKIGFYAGVPIASSDGYNLGSLCAIDNIPRKLNAVQLDALQKISNQITKLLDLRIKNKQIAETGKLLIDAEKKIAQINLKLREEENFNTAFHLHEDIAQSAAAIKMYITCARQNLAAAKPYLDHAAEELQNLLGTITSLSKSITPTTFKNDNYAGFIDKLVEDANEELHTSIDYKNDGLVSLNGETGLMAYRITQDLLKLPTLFKSDTVFLGISSRDELKFVFEYNVPLGLDPSEKEMVETNIINRVEMLKGNIILPAADDQRISRVEIMLPL